LTSQINILKGFLKRRREKYEDEIFHNDNSEGRYVGFEKKLNFFLDIFG